MSIPTAVLSVAFAVLVPLASVAAAQTLPAGSSWTLVEMPGKNLSGDRLPTLTADGTRVQGSDGCNRYTASYKEGSDGAFRISGGIARTKMACPGTTAMVARDFMAALTKTTRLRIEGASLTLLDGKGQALAVFDGQALAPPQALASSPWDVTAYNNGRQAVVSLIIGSRVTLAFGANGRVTGSAGCNAYTSTFTLDADQLAIGNAAVTRKMCVDPPGVMEQEAAFLKALGAPLRVQIEGPRLELRYLDGALALNATRAAGQ